MEAEVIHISGGSELLGLVRPLWEKLNQHHATHSPHFAAEYARKTFTGRKQALLEKSQSGKLHVELVKDDSGRVIGYCISSIDAQGVGEIDSLYLLPAWRGRALADCLLMRSLQWLEEQGVSRTRLSVAAGNERVFSFYAKHGFCPAKTILEQHSRD